MRRAIVAGTATVAGVILLLSLKPHNGGAGAVSSKVISSGGSPSSGSSSGSSASGSSSAAPSPGATGTTAAPATASRTITGSAVDTRYGPVQVRVVLDGTKISKIDVIRYPDQSGRDQEINSYALPQLNQEALAAQSAQIDVVSGASYTSDGYTRSLQSALDQAGK